MRRPALACPQSPRGAEPFVPRTATTAYDCRQHQYNGDDSGRHDGQWVDHPGGQQESCGHLDEDKPLQAKRTELCRARAEMEGDGPSGRRRVGIIGRCMPSPTMAGGGGQLLALATGIAMLMRAQLFRYTAQVASTLAAGLAGLVLLGLGLCLNPPHALMRDALLGDSSALNVRTLWLIAAIAAASALVTAVGLITSRRGVTPFWGRFTEIAEGFVLLTLVPLTLAVFDVYASVRALTS